MSAILTEFKYYVDESGGLHAFAADGSQDGFIRPGLKLKETDEIKDILVPPWNLTAELERLTFELNALYATKMKDLLSDYPMHERETWPIQLEEAKAFLADSTAPTPFLDACLEGREIDKAEFAAKIIAKDLEYRTEVGRMTGIRQDHLRALEAIPLLPSKSAKAATESYDLGANW